MIVPLNIQFPLFLKALSFDRNLQERVGDEIIIGILYQKKFRLSNNIKDKFTEVVRTSLIKKINNISIKYVNIDMEEPDYLEKLLDEQVNIVYLTPIRTIKIEKIVTFCRNNKITSLTSIPDYVNIGLAISIEIKKSKPYFIINLTAAKKEGANISSQLLKLAKIIE